MNAIIPLGHNPLLPAPASADPEHIETQCNNEALTGVYNTEYCQFVRSNSAGTSELSSLQSSLTFGDWYTGALMFLNIFTMGYLINMLEIVNFLPEFVFGMKLIFLVIIGIGFFYVVTGRGTKPSI